MKLFLLASPKSRSDRPEALSANVKEYGVCPPVVKARKCFNGLTSPVCKIPSNRGLRKLGAASPDGGIWGKCLCLLFFVSPVQA